MLQSPDNITTVNLPLVNCILLTSASLQVEGTATAINYARGYGAIITPKNTNL